MIWNKKRIAIVLGGLSILTACAHNSTNTAQNTEEIDRSPSSQMADTPWTNWYKQGVLGFGKRIGGLLVLKDIREKLLTESLHDPHKSYMGYGSVNCSNINTGFRTADGTCTDLSNPYVGAAGVAFGRNVPPEFIDDDAADKINEPNPVLVSNEFFTREEFKPVPFLNMLAAVWIQFMNHDWLTHGKNMDRNDNPHRISGPDGREHIVDRTKENPVSSNQYKSEFGKVTANDVTHWWDGSQIYGSSQEEQDSLRLGRKGKMKMVKVNGRELLPKDTSLNPQNNRQNQGYEQTGFRDNWWLGLSMLHTLFVKEHNRIAEELSRKHVKYNVKQKNFTWTNGNETVTLNAKELDERIFQTARLINAAIMAKIHTVEWTPAILPNPTLKIAMNANWYGIANPKTFKIPGFNRTDWNSEKEHESYLLTGIVGNVTNNYGVPFSITEEFTSVYRLHSLLPERLNLQKIRGNMNLGSKPFKFADTRNDKSYALMASYDLKDLFYSFGKQLPGQLVLNNFPKFMQNLEVPGHGSMDLGMVDVLRDRERGVPRYNQFRRGIGLKPIKSYKDFFPPDKPLDARQLAIIDKFNRVYGKNNVEDIDLLVGTLAEEVRPTNFGFGETMFQIFILMASRRLMADRFYTEYYKPEYYTQTGIDWVDREGTLAQVIVRHMPELRSKVAGLETAFAPWKN